MATSRNPLPHDQATTNRLFAARGDNPLPRSERYFLPLLRLVDLVTVVLGLRLAVDFLTNRPEIALLARLARLPPLFFVVISSASLSPLGVGGHVPTVPTRTSPIRPLEGARTCSLVGHEPQPRT